MAIEIIWFTPTSSSDTLSTHILEYSIKQAGILTVEVLNRIRQRRPTWFRVLLEPDAAVRAQLVRDTLPAPGGRHGYIRQHDARLLVLAAPAVFDDDIEDETDDDRGEDRAVERDDVGLGVRRSV